MYILQIENLHKSYDKFEAIKGELLDELDG